ncbi:NADPH-dependent FMN reductase [Pelagimonas varians]|uniref:NADPH azoreductase n=1 Tax=Pelagimonas varians TaxID=696760 RepID=A0A238KKS9_9RHOB|nr:NAD(P)H-dependent oxidoreductase [Pelagimonas varians]PYG29191.1 chromate reductase [Pelagimonas varians]SMX43381.1 NADPH azoreductase [Pelagimonas varians]
MSNLTLVGLSGALRSASTNTKLMNQAAARFDPAQFIVGNLRLPLYDGDLEAEQGIPEEVQLLADQIQAADAVIVVTPEYNKALSGVLKNALDWVSRVDGNPWAGKPVAVMSAAAGRTGGERAQSTLREALQPFQPRFVLGPDVALAQSFSQFDEQGALTNERTAESLDSLMVKLRAEAERLKSA